MDDKVIVDRKQLLQILARIENALEDIEALKRQIRS